MAWYRRIYEAKEISAVTGLSETLVKQYQALIRDSKTDRVKWENLQELIDRSGYREGLKKTSITVGKTAVPTMGGS